MEAIMIGAIMGGVSCFISVALTMYVYESKLRELGIDIW